MKFQTYGMFVLGVLVLVLGVSAVVQKATVNRQNREIAGLEQTIVTSKEEAQANWRRYREERDFNTLLLKGIASREITLLLQDGKRVEGKNWGNGRLTVDFVNSNGDISSSMAFGMQTIKLDPNGRIRPPSQ